MKNYRLGELSWEDARALCERNLAADPALLGKCRAIFEAIRNRGDEALRGYTRQFDGVDIAKLKATEMELSEAEKRLPSEALQSLQAAAKNIQKFHATQLFSEQPVAVQEGILCWRESRPIESVGLYVPGGTAVLPSTLLMLGIPARLAGCKTVVVTVAPLKDASVAPAILVAARIAGIKDVFKVGGAQAIAAMAIGTETVPKVDKILGPGSRLVQSAKLLASLNGVAIDMVAGPTEVLVIADDFACADFVAADLLSQAEHGNDSNAVLVTTSVRLLDKVGQLIEKKLQDLPRKAFAEASLEGSFSLLVESLDDGFSFSNSYAPEHLILHLQEPRRWLKKIGSAGSVFLGPWSPEVAGDYASGTNHTLPTSGMARSVSGVSLDSFVKKITFQELTREGLRDLAPTLETLAELEGLEAHRRAVRVRLERTDQLIS